MSEIVNHWLSAAGRFPLLTAAQEITLGHSVRQWLDHPDGPGAAPADVRRRGLRARNRMIETNLRLVVAVAKRYSARMRATHAPMEDLLQACTLGLLKAVERFDPARGYKFSTYAYWWIRQAATRFLDGDSVIHIPVHMGQLLASQNEQRIAELPQITRNYLAKAALAQRPASIDKRVGDDGSLLGDLIADPQQTDQLEALHWQDLMDRAMQIESPDWDLLLLKAGNGSVPTEVSDARGLQRHQVSARLTALKSRIKAEIPTDCWN